MAKGKVRDKRKEQLWRRWIRKWRASGLTVRAYCEECGLSEASFYAWRRELERRRAEAARFVPVHVVADEPQVAEGAIELVLAGKRSLRVAPGFDAATLRRLLAVLEDQPC
jgi:transposase